MLSLPDFREKQIVFVKASEIGEDHLVLKNENIRLVRADGTSNRLSCHKVLAIFVVGDCTVTTNLLRKCKDLGVSVFFLNSRFRLFAPLVAVAEGNYALRARQYAEIDTLPTAKHIVANKIANQLSLLRKAGVQDSTISSLVESVKTVESVESLDSLRGIEGSAARQFFAAYFEDSGWYRRMPRTRVDVPNLLLDIGYTMLFNVVDACLSLHGFDTYKGVYHQLFFQRKSLVCDLMEPFRCVIDKQLKKSYNLKQVRENDFEMAKGEYLLPYQNQGRYISIFADAIMDRKEDIFTFVRDYYYCVINENKQYPTFNI